MLDALAICSTYTVPVLSCDFLLSLERGSVLRWPQPIERVGFSRLKTK